MKTIWTGKTYNAMIGVDPNDNQAAKISKALDSAGVDNGLKQLFTNALLGQEKTILRPLLTAISSSPGVVAALNGRSPASKEVQDALAKEAKKVTISILYDSTVTTGTPRGTLILQMSYPQHAPPVWNAFVSI